MSTMAMTPAQAQLEAAIMESALAKVLGASKGTIVLPYYIGAWIDIMLMGVVISQLFSYWKFIKTDKVSTIVTVGIVGILAVTSSILILLWCTSLFVWNFGLYTPFTELKWTVRYRYVDAITIMVVQVFYIHRCCKLYRHWWPALVIGPCAAAATAMSFTGVTYMGSTYSYTTQEMQDDPLLKRVAFASYSFILITDSLITFIIAYGLWRIKTGWSHTDTVLRKLVAHVFETQIPALISSSITMIMWQRRYDLVLAFTMVSSKIYVLGVLITLNLRSTVSQTKVDVSTYPNSGEVKSTGSYPMGNLSIDPPRHSKSWEQDARTRGTATDEEMARHDSQSEVVDDKAYGSTTGLNSIKVG